MGSDQSPSFPRRAREGQQHRGGGGGVEGAIVAGGVQDPVEYAPQQVVAQAVHMLRDARNHTGKTAHCLGSIRVNGQRRQRRPSGLENRAVVHGEDAAPRLTEGADNGFLLRAHRCASRGPLPVVALRAFGRQVLMDSVVKKHSRCHNQHPTLCCYKVAVAVLPALWLSGREVQGLRQGPAHGSLHPLHRRVQAVR